MQSAKLEQLEKAVILRRFKQYITGGCTMEDASMHWKKCMMISPRITPCPPLLHSYFNSAL